MMQQVESQERVSEVKKPLREELVEILGMEDRQVNYTKFFAHDVRPGPCVGGPH
jgi:hypothetical protein